MTYIKIINGAGDVAQIDLGEFDHNDVWEALYDSHPEFYDLISEKEVYDVTEVSDGYLSEIMNLNELESFLYGYRFEYFNGNTGRITNYPTREEALYAASIMWDHLSVFDRRSYNPIRGAVFMVTDSRGMEIRNWLDE